MKGDEDDVPVTVGYVVALPHVMRCFVWKTKLVFTLVLDLCLCSTLFMSLLIFALNNDRPLVSGRLCSFFFLEWLLKLTLYETAPRQHFWLIRWLEDSASVA